MPRRLVDIADDLYGTAPADFIAARTAQVTDLGSDRDLAGQVKQLRKAAPAAWVVNLLTRHRRDDLEELLRLGADLRNAQAALDRAEITRLAHERRAAVTTMSRAGADLAAEAGHPVTAAVVDAVAATLDAGLADPEAADAIRTGRLLRALETIGFEPVDLAEAVAVPEAGTRAALPRERERPRPRAIDDSDAELVRARGRADAVLARAEEAAAEAADELGDLDRRVREARTALAAAERALEALERQRDSAERAHATAHDALDVARARRRDLG